MDLMDLLRTPWWVGALYLYGLIYISTDFWDFKDFCVHGSYGSTGFKVYRLRGLKGLAARAMAERGAYISTDLMDFKDFWSAWQLRLYGV